MLFFKELERATGKNYTVETRTKSRVLRALENDRAIDDFESNLGIELDWGRGVRITPATAPGIIPA